MGMIKEWPIESAYEMRTSRGTWKSKPAAARHAGKRTMGSKPGVATKASTASSAAPLSPSRSRDQSRAQSRNCQPAVHTQIITPFGRDEPRNQWLGAAQKIFRINQACRDEGIGERR
jgi:hypothetical protein